MKNSIKVFTELKLDNAYHRYIIEKTEINNPWKVISAVELDMRKKKKNDLPLPTLDDQNKANNKTLELLPALLNTTRKNMQYEKNITSGSTPTKACERAVTTPST